MSQPFRLNSNDSTQGALETGSIDCKRPERKSFIAYRAASHQGDYELAADRPRSAASQQSIPSRTGRAREDIPLARSDEHTSELQSLMRISYAVFCLKKKKQYNVHTTIAARLPERKSTSTTSSHIYASHMPASA